MDEKKTDEIKVYDNFLRYYNSIVSKIAPNSTYSLIMEEIISKYSLKKNKGILFKT